MIEYDSANSPRKIIIPISDPQEIYRYQRGVLGLLAKVEIGSCGSALNQDLKAVYALLQHMLSNDNLEQFIEADKVRRNSRKKKEALR
jgi:hypothetical protein